MECQYSGCTCRATETINVTIGGSNQPTVMYLCKPHKELVTRKELNISFELRKIPSDEYI